MKYIIIILIQLLLNISTITDKFNAYLLDANEAQEEKQSTVVDNKETSKQTDGSYTEETNKDTKHTNDLEKRKADVKETNETQNNDFSIHPEEQNMINYINQARMEHGLNSLTFDPAIYEVADIRLNEVSQVFSHTRPDGTPFFTVSSVVDGENLSRYGTGDAQSSFTGFMNSPAHKENILYPDFTRVACKMAVINGDVYWIQLFGY